MKNQKKAYLTVVMPAYNEEKMIRDNLRRAAKIIGSFAPDFRIIAVNDGSTDGTKQEIEAACRQDARIQMLSYDQNHGKGYAIKQGIMAANSQYIAFLDSDLELSPKLLRGYLKEMNQQNADIVIGSKMHKDSRLDYPFTRKVMSFGYYVMLRLMFHLKLKDTQTGIKLFRAPVIQAIMQEVETDGFSFDIEILAIAAAEGYKIIEMPVELKFSRQDGSSKSKISIKQIFGMIADTFRIKKHIRRLRKC
jgi:glycosyltransferase involved in cell wall biosynthesis